MNETNKQTSETNKIKQANKSKLNEAWSKKKSNIRRCCNKRRQIISNNNNNNNNSDNDNNNSNNNDIHIHSTRALEYTTRTGTCGTSPQSRDSTIHTVQDCILLPRVRCQRWPCVTCTSCQRWSYPSVPIPHVRWSVGVPGIPLRTRAHWFNSNGRALGIFRWYRRRVETIRRLDKRRHSA